MSIDALRANDTEEKKMLHHTDIDMTPKSVGLVFLAILVGLFITFYSFVSNAGLSLSVTLMFIVIGILVAILMGFFVAAACGYMAGLIGTSASRSPGLVSLASSSRPWSSSASALQPVSLKPFRVRSLQRHWPSSLPASSSASLLFPTITCRTSRPVTSSVLRRGNSRSPSSWALSSALSPSLRS